MRRVELMTSWRGRYMVAVERLQAEEDAKMKGVSEESWVLLLIIYGAR